MTDNYSNIERQYDAALRRAMEYEERKEYSVAAGEYKEAARLLIEFGKYLEPDEQNSLAVSIKRLLDTREKMLKLASTPVKKGTVTRGGNGDDENEIQFLPIAEHPNVHFDDIAGLEEAKQVIQDEIVMPRLHPDVYSRFNQDTNGGILLYGLPGTGKTMTAKAIATETNADFFPIRCSNIVAKWFGEAEKRVDALFEAARRSENAIIFFDEFDALGAKRGGNSTVMNRLVPELLTQMDGFEETKGRLTVIAATNIPWALDTAFIRRLPHRICVPLPDEEARRYMFNHMLKNIPFKDMAIDDLVKKTEGYSCADIKFLINYATRYPIRRQIKTDIPDFVTQGDMIEALKHCTSSIQPQDIAMLNKWNKDSFRND